MNKLVFINKLLYFCLEQKERGHDFFFEYSPHVEYITIRGYVGGWVASEEPDIFKHFSLEELTQRKVNAIIGHSLRMIGETPFAQAA